MNFTYEFTYSAPLSSAVDIGNGPYGPRQFLEVREGEVNGPRLKGRVLPGGGDWFLLGADDYGRLDVRGQFETDDGASIYVQYLGLLEVNRATRDALGGAATDFGDHYFRVAPRLETGDPRYAWVNQTLFVAEGRLQGPRAVEYRAYRVT